MSALLLFAICVAAQDLPEQTRTGLHCKSLPHTVVPEPDHPGSHVIITLASILPVKEFIVALSELSTFVAGHAHGKQLVLPAILHVPSLHILQLLSVLAPGTFEYLPALHSVHDDPLNPF